MSKFKLKHLVISFIILAVISLILAMNPFGIPVKIFRFLNLGPTIPTFIFYLAGLNLLIILGLPVYNYFKRRSPIKKLNIKDKLKTVPAKKHSNYFQTKWDKLIKNIDNLLKKNTDILVSLAKNLTFIFFILLFIDIYFQNSVLSLNWFAFGVFSIDALAMVYYSRTPNAEKWKPFFKYGFLALLLIVTLSSLTFGFMKPVTFFLKPFQIILTIITVFFGIVTFYLNKEVIDRVEDETNKEQKEEEKRKKKFSSKFPRINKIPVLRSLVKWMYKEGWWYGGIFILIFLLSFGVRFYSVGNFDFREDEFPVLDASVGFLNTHDFYKWDWIKDTSGKYSDCIKADPYCNYTRAFLHTVFVALMFKLFGISEFISRILSVFVGSLSVLVTYFFVKVWRLDKKVALMMSFFVAINYDFVFLSRYSRMYIFLIFSFLLTFYFISKYINSLKTKDYKNKFKFGILVFLFFLISLSLHINSIILLIPIFTLLAFYALGKRKFKFEIKEFFILGIIIITSLVALWFVYSGYKDYISFFSIKNYEYLDYLLKYPFQINIGIILLALGIFISIFDNEGKKRITVFYWLIMFTFLIFFIYLGDRYASFSYISNILVIPLTFISIALSTIFVIKFSKVLKVILFFLLISNLIIISIEPYKEMFTEQYDYGKYSVAYKSIDVKNLKGGVIFGQYLRGYYLKDYNLTSNNIEIIDMLNAKRYTFKQFTKDLNQFDKGYIVWDTRKNFHIDTNIRKYVCQNFLQLEGESCGKLVSNNKVEIFYFNNQSLKN